MDEASVVPSVEDPPWDHYIVNNICNRTADRNHNIVQLKGTLKAGLAAISLEGTWDFYGTEAPTSQPFLLQKTLSNEAPTVGTGIVWSGRYEGSFEMGGGHVSETVQLTFDRATDNDTQTYNIQGKGHNIYGKFVLEGSSTYAVLLGDDECNTVTVKLIKTYVRVESKMNPKRKRSEISQSPVSKIDPTKDETARNTLLSGFLFLPDTMLAVQNKSDNHHATKPLATRIWTNVSWDTTTTTTTPKDDSGPINSSNEDMSHDSNVICNRCHIPFQISQHNVNTDTDVLSSSSGMNRSCLELSARGLGYDGTVSDMKPCQSCCHSRTEPTEKNAVPSLSQQGKRNDASLLLGLVWTTHAMLVANRESRTGIPELELPQVQVLLHSPSKNQRSSHNVQHYRAALLIRVQLFPWTNHAKIRRATLPASSPAPIQLLYSLLRNDWTQLRKQMNDMTQPESCFKADQPVSTPTLFPEELTLQELYARIQGAGSHAVDDRYHTSTRQTEKYDANYLTLQNLPDEVLTGYVTPFLMARSLDALRGTCWQLHRGLRAVIPGMKLRLYQHQVTSLDWMRRREAKLWTEDEILSRINDDTNNDGSFLDNDFHRCVTAGTSVLLQTHGSINETKISYRLDSQTGGLYGRSSSLSSSVSGGRLRRVARGGLLCDDPGLGKTITVLSLILQTFGLTTESNRKNDGTNTSIPVVTDHDVFHIYWKDVLTLDYQHAALLWLVNQLRRCNAEAKYFENPNVAVLCTSDSESQQKGRSICMRDILQNIKLKSYGDDFEGFCDDVKLCFQNAMLCNLPDHHIYKAAEQLLQTFDNLVHDFKAEQICSAKRQTHLRRNHKKLAHILTESAKNELFDALSPSSGTLIVVPNTLLHHWQDQIMLHVSVSYCSSKIPVVYGLPKSRNSHFFHGCACNLSLEEMIHLCTVKNTHYPLLFVDSITTKDLPSAEVLAMFKIVVTSSQRFSLEWKHGSMTRELRRHKMDNSIALDVDEDTISTIPDTICCPLLKVHWLRLIVDEGHTMGGSTSNVIQFASWITAQRRWAMTGTPTPQTLSNNSLRNIYCLLGFLKHDYFTSRFEGDKMWKKCIANYWKDRHLVSFFRLRSLLSLLMVRHTKFDIVELPPPVFTKTYTMMSNAEICAYDTLASAIQSNIITTSMEGKTSGWQDSLLNPRQSQNARQAFSNIRLACSGGTSVVPTLSEKNWTETLQYLKEDHGVDPIRITVVDNFFHRMTSGEMSSCMCCGVQLSTLFVMPCADLVCTECIDNKTTECPVCQKAFDVDKFQLLQPGIDYTWKWNLDEAKEGREREAMLKREIERTRRSSVEGNLVEANHLEGDGQIMDHDLILNENRPRSIRRKHPAHICEYPSVFIDAKCNLCREEHRECNMMNEKSECSICHRAAEDCPQEESKFYYIIRKLIHLRGLEQFDTRNNSFRSSTASRVIGETVHSPERRALKVIIFSQFRPILNLIGDRLIRKFGDKNISEYWGYAKAKELDKFIYSPDCFIMLLSRDGSHGLDLSFVTHMFFMEEIWDKSLEQQVVARSYRMGTKGHVEIEQLVSRNSVEELMANMNDREGEQSAVRLSENAELHEAKHLKHAVHTKQSYLLKSLRLIRNDMNGVLPQQRKRDIAKPITVAESSSIQCNYKSDETFPKQSNKKAVRFL